MNTDRTTIVFLFNSSRYAVQPWLDDGRFECVSVDYEETDHSGTEREQWNHERHTRISADLSRPFASYDVQMAINALGLAPPSFVVSFAPCTDLAVSGARHFESKRQRDPQFQQRAVSMARIVELFECPYVVENPVSVLSTLWRKPDVTCHPYQFADWIPDEEVEHPEFPGIVPRCDSYYKRTCLWLGNGALAPVVAYGPEDVPQEGANPGWAKLGGKSARTKYIRSLTPRGLSIALYQSNCSVALSFYGNQGFTGTDSRDTLLESNTQLELFA